MLLSCILTDIWAFTITIQPPHICSANAATNRISMVEQVYWFICICLCMYICFLLYSIVQPCPSPVVVILIVSYTCHPISLQTASGHRNRQTFCPIAVGRFRSTGWQLFVQVQVSIHRPPPYNVAGCVCLYMFECGAHWVGWCLLGAFKMSNILRMAKCLIIRVTENIWWYK